jgi:signal transduction histidine kinase
MAASFLLVALGLLIVGRQQVVSRIPRFHDSFSIGMLTGWESFDGSWSLVEGTLRNDSNDRGAKFMTGSRRWRDYSMEADVQVLGHAGDVGLVIRSNDEEEGVDSYQGYYVGLRVPDGALVIGRAKYGWAEYQDSLLPKGIAPFHWYHLKIVAYGCTIVGSVVDPDTGQSSVVALDEGPDMCAQAGRIGLRSYQTGGAWKNIQVLPANEGDLSQLIGTHEISRAPLVPRSLEQVMEGAKRWLKPRLKKSVAGVKAVQTQPIGNLALIRPRNSIVSVHGTVVLTQPTLYIEDSTGGVSISGTNHQALNVGDEVEATGLVETDEFRVALTKSAVRFLWAGIPTPPLAITVSQAATGVFDSQFVDLEASLDTVENSAEEGLILSVHDRDQHFRAVLSSTSEKPQTTNLTQGSRLRVHGVCVTSAQYTKRRIPFVLLLRSMEDVQRVAGPPWWSKRNLLLIFATVVSLGLLSYLFYIRAEHWRLHAILDERQRLAHELHDTLAQSFAGIGFQLRAMAKTMPRELNSLHKQLDLASQLVAQGHLEAKRSISTLHPQGLDPIDLLPTLAQSARALVAGGSVKINVIANSTSRRIPLKVKDVLYRVGIEAVANAVRHAQATEIDLITEYAVDRLVLTVADDGVGFIQDAAPRGFGLLGMKKRVESVGGEIVVDSAAGVGTKIKVEVPLPRSLVSNLIYRRFNDLIKSLRA